MHIKENIISFQKTSQHTMALSNMTLNNMTADPFNMIFFYHYQNHLYSNFYHQVDPGTTIGCIINVK